MIDGVQLKPLRFVPDERGRLMEILRCDDKMFEKFGQVYLTTTYPGVIKGWHYHKKQNDNVTVIKGMLKLVLFDRREGSPTFREINELFIGVYNPMLVHIPKGICHGWKCIGQEEALVINCVTEPYDHKTPDEYRLTYDSDEVPYDWEIKMG
jgi:dTDP-4-dehydrorhamnose 3,5-epimerase